MTLSARDITSRLDLAFGGGANGAGVLFDDIEPDIVRNPAQDLTPAAVLIPLVIHPGGVTVLLTRRTDHLADHAGQISFPGGRIEPEDADASAAALRETFEEIGLGTDHVKVIGQFAEHGTSTGFRVIPVVGLVSPPFDLILDAHEVADAFEVPLDFITDPANCKIETGLRKGRRRRTYAFHYQDRVIWGFTARILAGLAKLLEG
ncbi:MAG: CoA pyrophosphatase [Alphaproteobacteria bacterium]